MKILVTGAKGFVGRNLVENLKNFRDKKNRTRNLDVEEIFECDMETDDEELRFFCGEANFVFDFAGVNRPKNTDEFMKGNYGFTEKLISFLDEQSNNCPVVYSSSIQASLSGKYAESEYGKSKLAGEEYLFEQSKTTDRKVLIYRFPNLFGKWCRPNYNSVVATFCYNLSRDLPIYINNDDEEIQLLYIDDLMEEMYDALEGSPHRCRVEGLDSYPDNQGKYCYAPITYKIKLGDLAGKLKEFKEKNEYHVMSEMPIDSFEKKLYSTYLSYLPDSAISSLLDMNVDNRGSFTEVVKIKNYGQISVAINHPGITRGEHWHNTKWEKFVVVSGKGMIQERKIGSKEIKEYLVSGDKLEEVYALPGYTHNIINLSDSEDLVTLVWTNEFFDPNRPDTFHEEI